MLYKNSSETVALPNQSMVVSKGREGGELGGGIVAGSAGPISLS